MYHTQVHQFSQEEKNEVRQVVEGALTSQAFAFDTEASQVDQYALAVSAIGFDQLFALIIKYGPVVLDLIRQIIEEFRGTA